MAAVAHRQGEHPHPSGSRHPHDANANANPVVRKKSSAQPVNERNDAKMIGQWRIGRTIGKGSSGGYGGVDVDVDL
jgi:serine/threonine-protein kinase HSL1 (negative regulator of Swe1 kinase)